MVYDDLKKKKSLLLIPMQDIAGRHSFTYPIRRQDIGDGATRAP
jgi:hypothetical protein